MLGDWYRWGLCVLLTVQFRKSISVLFWSIMKNQLDLLELMAHRRKVCRIHLTDIEEYTNLTLILQTLSDKLVHQITPAIHPGTDKFYVYISFSLGDLVSAIRYDRHNDHKQLGLMFGYPDCCVKSFCDNIHIRPANDDEDIKYWAPAFADGIHVWRFSKVMNPELALLAHFPCALRCSPSVAIAKWRMQFKFDGPLSSSTYTFNKHTYEFSLS